MSPGGTSDEPQDEGLETEQGYSVSCLPTQASDAYAGRLALLLRLQAELLALSQYLYIQAVGDDARVQWVTQIQV